jgi:putative phosphotransacetylase
MEGDLRAQVERIVREVVGSMLRGRRVPIHVSARHLHITIADLEVLFGPGARLTKLRDLMQPGEFAANETVAAIGPNGRRFEAVRILGPERKATQVELSYTDSRSLGLDLQARISGDIRGTAPIALEGPRGTLELKEGVIRALRHVHMHTEDAKTFGVENGERIRIRTDGELRLVFENVIARVSDIAALEMHIDTDEGNAAGLTGESYGEIVK